MYFLNGCSHFSYELMLNKKNQLKRLYGTLMGVAKSYSLLRPVWTPATPVSKDFEVL